MTAQDVAGVIAEELRDQARNRASKCGTGSEVATVEWKAADFIESQAQALSKANKEVEFQRRRANSAESGWLKDVDSWSRDRSRLAEAMRVIEPLVEALEFDCVGDECKDEDPNDPVALTDEGSTKLTFGMIYAARDFLNAANARANQEQTNAQ